MTARYRPAWAEIDLDAVASNAALLGRLVHPAKLCTVVKADGYGHGAIEIATAALQGGATILGVALAEEAIALREAGVAAPLLLLTEAPPDAIADLIAAEVTATVYRPEGVEQAREAADRLGCETPVHVKVDTGMHRVGADLIDAVGICALVGGAHPLVFDGLWTHLAVADEPDDPFTDLQLDRFDDVVSSVRRAGLEPRQLHAANSAGAIAHPRSRYDFVRCGIASYGYPPSAKVAPFLARELGRGESLRPVLSLKARVHLVRELAAGERPSYGRRYELSSNTLVAVVPLGYADGVTRGLSSTGGEVLIGGRRRRIAGTVTMDQIIVECDGDDVRPGDEVVLIGRQGDDEITAEEWAERTDTVAYEVLCGIGPRVPRIAVSSGVYRSASGDLEEPLVAVARDD